MKLLSNISQLVSTTALFAVICACSAQGQTIAQWTFENSYTYIQANPGPGTTITGIVPEIGSGTASGVHASSSTVWSSPAGNGSSHSLSANNWAGGDYYEFRVGTLGFENITVSYDQASSSTGPGSFSLAYSTDGASFTSLEDYGVLQNGGSPNPAWNGTTSSSVYSYLFDLSSVSEINNSAAVYFRLLNAADTTPSGGVIGTGGTDRVDNFTVAVAVIPEPRGLFLFGGVSALIATFAGRRSSESPSSGLV